MVENRLVGIKSRGAYETPGGTLLVIAHRELESLCLDRETAHYPQILSLRYAEMVYYGMWFTALRESLDAFFTTVAKARDGFGGLAALQGQCQRTRRQIAIFAIPHRSGELHHDALQPQGCRRIHQSFRAADHCPAKLESPPRLDTALANRKNMWGGLFERGPDESFYEFERPGRSIGAFCLRSWRSTARGRGPLRRPAS